jgi:VWFA-related protein
MSDYLGGRLVRNRFILIVMLIVVIAALVAPAATRLSAQEKKKPEDFGSSLKRLKWDDKKKAAVEKEEKKKDSAKVDATTGATSEEEVIRVETDLAVIQTLVLDRNRRFVTGLTKEDFIITEDGKPQEIATLSLGDGMTLPRSIVLIIDYSGSQYPFLSNSLDAARILVDRLRSTDRMTIVTDDIELLVPFTSDKDELKAGLETLRKRAAWQKMGRSKQYSALLATLRELVEGEERPIIIFQTDGDELDFLRSPVGDDEGHGTQFGMGDVIAAAEKSRGTIYSVIPGFRLIGLPAAEQIARMRAWMTNRWSKSTSFVPRLNSMSDDYFLRLAETRRRQQTALTGLSKLTGGWAEYLEEPDQAVSIYARIFSGIHNSYIIGLYPLNEARDGKRRKIEIKIRDHPDYVIWGRKSYIVPAN